MKGLLKTLSAVFVLGILFTGCKKEKEAVAGYFQVASGTVNELSWGIIEYWGEGSTWTGHAYKIYLVSDDIEMDVNNDLTGTGDYIRFVLSSSTGTGIASGEYTYQLFADGFENHFDEDSYWCTGLNTGTEDYTYLNSGTLVVENKGDNNYKFEFNGTDTEGNSVKAHYDGSIDYVFDYSKK